MILSDKKNFSLLPCPLEAVTGDRRLQGSDHHLHSVGLFASKVGKDRDPSPPPVLPSSPPFHPAPQPVKVLY
jgi:hypothetical protein